MNFEITHSHEAPPLVVDLDGTLTARGMTREGLRRLARERPWCAAARRGKTTSPAWSTSRPGACPIARRSWHSSGRNGPAGAVLAIRASTAAGDQGPPQPSGEALDSTR
jgi:hypothetical protein